MSIWATQYCLETPERDKYGRVLGDGESRDRVYVCTSGMSDLIRLTTVYDGQAYVTPGEAREIAAALIAAADVYDGR